MPERLSPALRAVSDAVLAVAAQRSVDEVLQELVDRARELAGARYAALGVPDGEGGFRAFLVSGMSEELIASLGPLPRTHGVLGDMLSRTEPVRTEDLHAMPAFRGWWPRGHPDMRSFLGVPIVGGDGDVLGAFYLAHKEDAETFSPADQELIELLATHAAIAIVNARLDERSRELSIVSERNRLALELHDVVSQKLFGLTLTAEAALQEPDPAAAREHVVRMGALAREALEELRGLIEELRPPDLERDGFGAVLRKHVDLLRALHDVDISLELEAELDDERDREVLRIAQEALHNALRHADARRVWVRVTRCPDGEGLVLDVGDDGGGFSPDDPELRARHLGLTSMEERARRIGGRLEIRSAPDDGTSVRLELRP